MVNILNMNLTNKALGLLLGLTLKKGGDLAFVCLEPKNPDETKK